MFLDKVIVIFIIISSFKSFGKNVIELDAQPNLNSIELTLAKNETPIAIQYSTKNMGTFELKEFQQIKNKVSFSFFPPTFLQPVDFSILSEGPDRKVKNRFVKSIKFENKLKQKTLPSFRTQGDVKLSYLLVNMHHNDNSTKTIYSDVVIANRHGELIWKKPNLLQQKDKMAGFLPVFFKKFENKYYFLSKYKETQLEIYNWTGQLETVIDFKEENFPISTHTFDFNLNTNELYYLSPDCRELPWYKEFTPLFSGLKGLYYLARLPRRTYAGDNLIALNVLTKKYRKVWSSYDSFSPENFPSLFMGTPENRPDLFMDIRTKEAYLKVKSTPNEPNNWTENCDVDWTHGNSVKFDPNTGFLVSLRNVNKVLLLDVNGKLKWTIGEDESDTYQIKRQNQMFSMQHSASFIENNSKILIFDNNISYRGSRKYYNKFKNLIKIIHLPSKTGAIEKVEAFDLPAPLSMIRGAAQQFGEDHLFAFSPGHRGTRETAMVLQRDGSLLGFIDWISPGTHRGVEAIPLSSIGAEALTRRPNLKMTGLEDYEKRLTSGYYECGDQENCAPKWDEYVY